MAIFIGILTFIPFFISSGGVIFNLVAALIEYKSARKFSEIKKYIAFSYIFSIINVISSISLFFIFKYFIFVYILTFIPLLALITSALAVIIFGKKILDRIK